MNGTLLHRYLVLSCVALSFFESFATLSDFARQKDFVYLDEIDS